MRRALFAPIALGHWLLLAVTPLFASTLPVAEDLQADGRLSRQAAMPIMVFYATDSCPYCELVRELYLQPMYNSKAYSEKVLFRVVKINSVEGVRDFSGRQLNHGSLASQQGVSFVPVIRFYDPAGSELVPELFGYTSPDFYAGFLEESIATSVAKMRVQQGM